MDSIGVVVEVDVDVVVHVHATCAYPYICSDVYNHMISVCETFSDTSKPFEQHQKNANVHGYKWTELLRLPYFEPSRFVTIDPMHCLFLGT